MTIREWFGRRWTWVTTNKLTAITICILVGALVWAKWDFVSSLWPFGGENAAVVATGDDNAEAKALAEEEALKNLVVDYLGGWESPIVKDAVDDSSMTTLKSKVSAKKLAELEAQAKAQVVEQFASSPADSPRAAHAEEEKEPSKKDEVEEPSGEEPSGEGEPSSTGDPALDGKQTALQMVVSQQREKLESVVEKAGNLEEDAADLKEDAEAALKHNTAIKYAADGFANLFRTGSATVDDVEAKLKESLAD